MSSSVDTDRNIENWQEKLVFRFLAASFIIHLLLWAAHKWQLIDTPSPLIQEWAIETELVSSVDLGASSKTVIQDAKESEEVTVPDNLLPQLPKRISVKQPEKAEEGLKEETVPEEKVDISKAKEEKEEPPPVQAPDPDATNKIDANELRKRQALEQLRKQPTKRSKELTANEDNMMDRIKDALNEGGPIASEKSGMFSSAASRRYQAYLDRTIRRNYSLPETYKFVKKPDDVIFALRINTRGGIQSIEIDQSSGDEALDNYCLDVVKRSAPFEAPPKVLAGQPLKIRFKP